MVYSLEPAQEHASAKTSQSLKCRSFYPGYCGGLTLFQQVLASGQLAVGGLSNQLSKSRLSREHKTTISVALKLKLPRTLFSREILKIEYFGF